MRENGVTLNQNYASSNMFHSYMDAKIDQNEATLLKKKISGS